MGWECPYADVSTRENPPKNVNMWDALNVLLFPYIFDKSKCCEASKGDFIRKEEEGESQQTSYNTQKDSDTKRKTNRGLFTMRPYKVYP